MSKKTFHDLVKKENGNVESKFYDLKKDDLLKAYQHSAELLKISAKYDDANKSLFIAMLPIFSYFKNLFDTKNPETAMLISNTSIGLLNTISQLAFTEANAVQH